MKMPEVSHKLFYIFIIIFIDLGFRLPFLEYIIVHLKMNVIIFGYRGYGKSEGTPNEEGVLLDGITVGKFVFENKEIEKYVDKEQVFLFGRSLGGAVAARVALDMTLPFKGVIIENTFTTLADLVDVMFPFLRYIRKYLLKAKFETIDIIGKIKRPILFCRSEKDELIPKIQMDALYNAATGALFKKYYTIHEGSHNDGFRTDIIGYANAIEKFMEDCNNYYKQNKNINIEKNKEKSEDKEFSCTNDNSSNNDNIKKKLD